MERLTYAKPFILTVYKKLDEIANDNYIHLRAFLTEKQFKFKTEFGTEHVYFHIDCDNFTDAATIETFLCTEN